MHGSDRHAEIRTLGEEEPLLFFHKSCLTTFAKEKSETEI